MSEVFLKPNSSDSTFFAKEMPFPTVWNRKRRFGFSIRHHSEGAVRYRDPLGRRPQVRPPPLPGALGTGLP